MLLSYQKKIVCQSTPSPCLSQAETNDNTHTGGNDDNDSGGSDGGDFMMEGVGKAKSTQM